MAGRVAKELEAVELVWGETLFPPGSLNSSGYPTKETLRSVCAKQLEELGDQAKESEGATFVDLLMNAGCKAEMHVADDHAVVQDIMERSARALSLLTAARLVRLRSQAGLLGQRTGGARGGEPEEGEAQPQKRQQVELVAIKGLIRSLIHAMRRMQEGRNDILLTTLGDAFHQCSLCASANGMQKAPMMVRCTCGHVLCMECYGKLMLGSGAGLATCPLGMCKDFQAVEIGPHIAFLGASTPKRLPLITIVGLEWITRVGPEDEESEGFDASLKDSLKEWNRSLRKARKRALRVLEGRREVCGGVLGEIEDEMVSIQHRVPETFRSRLLLVGLAQAHIGWVRWMRGDKEGAAEALQHAVGVLKGEMSSDREDFASFLVICRFVASALGALGMLHFRAGLDLLPIAGEMGQAREVLHRAKGLLEQSLKAGQGAAIWWARELWDALGHTGMFRYAMGVAGILEEAEASEGACEAYGRQLELCGEVRVDKSFGDAIRLNLGLLQAKSGNFAEARATLRLDVHMDGNIFQPLAHLLDSSPHPAPPPHLQQEDANPGAVRSLAFVEAADVVDAMMDQEEEEHGVRDDDIDTCDGE